MKTIAGRASGDPQIHTKNSSVRSAKGFRGVLGEPLRADPWFDSRSDRSNKPSPRMRRSKGR